MVEDSEASALRCLSFFEISSPSILRWRNLRESGDRALRLLSEIVGRNHFVRSAPCHTSDYFPTILTTQACLQTYGELLILQYQIRPFLRDLHDTHIDDLPDRIISREYRLGFRELSHNQMVTFNNAGRIYYLPYFRRTFEESRMLTPVPISGFQDIRILLISLLTELLFGKFSVLKIHRSVYLLEISADSLPTFVWNELAAVPNR